MNDREHETGWWRLLWPVKPTRAEYGFWLMGFGVGMLLTGFACLVSINMLQWLIFNK